jgi:hypothetical protein
MRTSAGAPQAEGAAARCGPGFRRPNLAAPDVIVARNSIYQFVTCNTHQFFNSACGAGRSDAVTAQQFPALAGGNGSGMQGDSPFPEYEEQSTLPPTSTEFQQSRRVPEVIALQRHAEWMTGLMLGRKQVVVDLIQSPHPLPIDN